MQITKYELVRELAEMADWKGKGKNIRGFDDLPPYRKLHFEIEAERFIRALNNIRRRKQQPTNFISGRRTQNQFTTSRGKRNIRWL